MEDKGLIHIYYGEGKGKTTAATGLAVRAAGAGRRVIFAQFLKKGDSSEINILRSIPGIRLFYLNTHRGFIKKQSKEELELTKVENTGMFREIIDAAKKEADMLVLDEMLSTLCHELVPSKELISFLKEKPESLEVVLTGRYPTRTLVNLADYVTEMKKKKHPYDKGIMARKGIEF